VYSGLQHLLSCGDLHRSGSFRLFRRHDAAAIRPGRTPWRRL